MLQAIRDRAKGFVAAVIIALICIPFAFVGIENYFTQQIDTFVATVNGEEISEADFQREFSNYRQRMRHC